MDKMIFQRCWRPLFVYVTPCHNWGTLVESLSCSSSQAWLIPVSSLIIVLLWWMNIFSGPSAAPLFRDRPQFGRSREYERSFFFFFSKSFLTLGIRLSTFIVLWRRGTYRGHVSFSDQWAVLVSGDCLFSFPHFSRQNLLTLLFFHLFTFLLHLTSLTSILFFSLRLISLSLLLLLHISLHPIRFSSLFLGTFAYFYAFSFFGCTVFFSFAFLFSFLGLRNFPEWWVILNLGIFLPSSPFFSLAWGAVRFFWRPIPTNWGFHCRG